MVETPGNKTTNGIKTSNSVTLTSAFCVALSSLNQPVKLYSDNPVDFLVTINDAKISWVNCTVEDIEKNGAEIVKTLGFGQDLFQSLLVDSPSVYEDEDLELGMKIPIIRVFNLEVRTYPLLILIKRNLILTVHTQEVVRLKKFARYAETFMRKIPSDAPWQDKITMVLYRILSENNERNFDGLRAIEEEADVISKDLMEPTTPRQKLGAEIYRMKHALILYLNDLWNILDVLHSLRYGDAEIITDDPTLLARLDSLVMDIRGQISLSEHMSEVLASGLEVLQSIYNNQLQILNNRMALVITWLTILGTAVLVPNTLATIFSNPAYGLGPSDIWWYSALMVVSTLVATWLAYLFVKTWMPKRVD
jgi:magnesium transporter